MFGFQNRGGLRQIVEEDERDSDTRTVGAVTVTVSLFERCKR